MICFQSNNENQTPAIIHQLCFVYVSSPELHGTDPNWFAARSLLLSLWG